MHEALSGSCLRVFDTEFVPAYREQMSRGNERELALVADVKHDQHTGEVTSLRLYIVPESDVVSVPMIKCAGLHEREQVRTGAHLSVETSMSRPHLAAEVFFHDAGEYTLLVSDTRARQGPEDRWKFRAVRRPQSLDQLRAGTVLVDPEVVSDFNHAAAGLADRKTNPGLRGAVPGLDGWLYEPVGDRAYNRGRGGKTLGRRLVARGPGGEILKRGQPVWVQRNTHKDVTWVGLSQIWRSAGHFSAGERAGDASPCRTDLLCPSCQMFGSIEQLTTDEKAAVKEGRGAEQHSYAGHVWVGSGQFSSAPVLEVLTLPRVDSPRPGAGQFNLAGESIMADDPEAQRRLPLAPQRPLREWGASADHGQPRPIRGSKRYWTSSWPGRAARIEAQTAGAAQDEVVHRACAPVGSVFTVQIFFEGLSTEQVGSLIAAVDPARWLAAWHDSDVPAEAARFRLGGGKPFGLGAARSGVTLHLADMPARWTGDSEDPPDALTADAAVEAFVAAAPAPVVRTWRALAHMVTEDFVNPQLVSYPRHEGPPEQAPFHFWKESIGHQRTSRERTRTITPFVALPTAEQPATEQVLDTADARTVPGVPEQRRR
ncbi:hypothetical protein [Ornithinimicrobium kibberense]|uniref:CRISPR-associated protein (TIGR03986 family) n=1 Tax=Ornithinimicrobium kibberense TaxID=282060 RepID=A0ABV5V6P7_9MICO